jgi:RNA polymerase sigma-70 factor (ECF subfamily)
MSAHHYRELLNHLTHTLNDRHSAADIVQESYARMLALQQSGQDVQQPRAWLYRTARNLVIDRYRRLETRTGGAALNEPETDLDTLAGPEAIEPETAVASAQAVAAMLGAIDKLPLRCREAFVLHRFDGLPHAEVAARMGISRKTVEQHVKAAMNACSRCKANLDALCETAYTRRATPSSAQVSILARTKVFHPPQPSRQCASLRA